jgi:gliding motility-associated-like protein
LLVVSLISQTNVLCFGAATGTITVGVLGGNPITSPTGVTDYLYSWTGPNGFTSNLQNLSNLFAGTYDLSVTDANGCIKTLTVIVTQSPEILIGYTTTPITCYGANNATMTVTLSGGSGPYQYLWSNLATTLNQTNLSAGNYTITVTDNLGCVKVATITIPEAPVFMVNPIVSNVSCFGAHDGSINLNLTGGIPLVSLVWSDGSTSGLIRNNLGPGTYTATISDGTPCYIVRTFSIIEPMPLSVSATLTNALDCTNAMSGAINILVAGGTPSYTYSWSNGTTTEDLVNITSGNYQVIVTDTNGCSRTQQYTVYRPAPILIDVTTQTDFNCSSHTVNQNFIANVSGGVPPYQLHWSSGTISGINHEIMHTTVNGTVFLDVTDNLGCTSNYTLQVDIPEIGYNTFNPNSYGYTTYGLYSIGDPIQFQSTVTGDYVSISWDFGDGIFSTELNPIHTYVNPRDYVVRQTVTYPFGCVYVYTITLLVEKGYVLVVPTAFTPNEDNLNDTFRPVTKGLKNIVLDVYDTWGNLIYSETGEVLHGWDGKINGFNAENGNYYSKVRAETFYGAIVNKNETFVLIK